MNCCIRNGLLSVAIILILTGGVPLVRAQTGVWYVAPGGNDNNDCLSPSTPCATFARVIFNAAPGGTVRAAIGTYTDVGEEVVQISKDITLSGGWDSAFLSQVGRSTVDGQNARHGIVLLAGVTASIDRFTIQHGSVPRYYYNYLGGGINNNGGNLILTNSQVISNTARSIYSYGMGGGIHNRLGNLTIISSTIAGNHSGSSGAGMFITSGTVVIRDSSIVGNAMDASGSGGAGGGGIYNGGMLSIERSVIDGNRVSGAFPGAAIHSGGILTITNSTIARNIGWSTIIENFRGAITLNNVTVSRNTGIGIYNDWSGILAARNSIIANNTISDCYDASGARFNSLGYNLIGVSVGCGLSPTDTGGVDPKLASPQGNPLHLMPLLGSPAINSGDPTGCVDSIGAPLGVDQRSVARNGRCDIGAIEAQLAFDKQATGPFYPGGTVTYTIALSNTTASQSFSGVSITDSLPSDLVYIPGSLSATMGTATVTDNTLNWSGSLGVTEQATVTFGAEIAASPSLFGKSITNTAFITWPNQTYTDTTSFLSASQLYTLTKGVQGEFRPGGLITYTVVLASVGQGFDLAGVTLTDTLPGALTYVSGSLTASAGTGTINGDNTITWTGDVPNAGASTISYAAHIGAPTGQPITNTVESRWKGLSQTASALVIPISHVYVPLMARNYCAPYFDDFSYPGSGWPIGENDFVRYGYVNSEYLIQSKQGGYLYLFRSPSCFRESYVTEVDARWEGTPGDSYGLIFGVVSGFSQYYLFYVSSDYGDYALFRRSPSGFTVIQSFTPSPAIRPGGQTNHLRAARNGFQITLEINGTILGTWYDSAIGGWTYAGLYSNPYDAPPTSDARFDNFAMVDLVNSSFNAQKWNLPLRDALEFLPVTRAGWPANVDLLPNRNELRFTQK